MQIVDTFVTYRQDVLCREYGRKITLSP